MTILCEEDWKSLWTLSNARLSFLRLHASRKSQADPWGRTWAGLHPWRLSIAQTQMGTEDVGHLFK